MNALFLKDLAEKTRCGLQGRVQLGKSGGGNSYSYDVVRKLDANGEPIRGDRSINETTAASFGASSSTMPPASHPSGSRPN